MHFPVWQLRYSAASAIEQAAGSLMGAVVLNMLRSCCCRYLAIVFCCGIHYSSAEEVQVLAIASPVPYQVVQRQGFVPQYAHEHQLGGPALGFADVEVRLEIPQLPTGVCEFRAVLQNQSVENQNGWMPLALTPSENGMTGVARVAAGGWYRLEIRFRRDSELIAVGNVEPFGVGEVFLIAGQSYATNCNDERLRVHDVEGRVAAFSSSTRTWQLAHDPQPVPDGSDGGSVWPACADLLLSSMRVPIGLANTAFGGTSSSQWLPEGTLHRQMVATGNALGRFRAVLWQQGESDVIGAVSTDQYVKNLVQIRAKAVAAWRQDVPWLLAKSTLHPTVYKNPAGEARIRQAIDQLCGMPGFVRGPDTDVLGGVNRGGADTRRHFSAVGQRNAGAMWYASISHLLNTPRPEHELALRMLPELHLLNPAWTSEIVHRESSVLLQMDGDQPPVARTAFPMAEVLRVATADGKHEFESGKDFVVGDDRQTLTFTQTGPVTPISADAMFPPRDAPNSYRHRVSNPEQNLLYAPGNWFHDRNVEISYRRADSIQPSSELSAVGLNDPGAAATVASQSGALSLPRTRARLKAGQSLSLAVSGDSISTGLDASALSAAAPWQPGYVELVAAQLQATFGSEIRVTNRSVAGWSVVNGLNDLDELLKASPDLLIVAYGMNDVGRRNPDWFEEQMKQFVERVRSVAPDMEMILVTPMLGHSEWIHTPREMFPLYRDVLKSLTDNGTVLADLTTVWEILLRTKHDLDLTGNGLNHPNDFGHRLYAQSILSLLVSE